MKPLPPGLPPANSRKWHARRYWDTLGYLRVRTLANPYWHRDTRWLIHVLRAEADIAEPDDRPLDDQAISATRRYGRLPHQGTSDDDGGDQVLVPIDELLMRRHPRHVADVRRAQANLRRPVTTTVAAAGDR